MRDVDGKLTFNRTMMSPPRTLKFIDLYVRRRREEMIKAMKAMRHLSECSDWQITKHGNSISCSFTDPEIVPVMYGLINNSPEFSVMKSVPFAYGMHARALASIHLGMAYGKEATMQGSQARSHRSLRSEATERRPVTKFDIPRAIESSVDLDAIQPPNEKKRKVVTGVNASKKRKIVVPLVKLPELK